MAHIEARPRGQEPGVGRFGRLSESIVGSMRSVRLGTLERASIAQRFMRPLPLQAFEHAQLGRAMGRLVAGVYDPRRIHNREVLLLRRQDGRIRFLETYKEVVTSLAVKGIQEDKKREEIKSVIDRRFDELIEATQGKSMSVREFVALVNRTTKETLQEAGVGHLAKNARDLMNAYFLNMRAVKGSEGRVALVDPITGRAYLLTKGDERVTVITVTDTDVSRSLRERGVSPEDAPTNVREIETLRVLLSKLRADGFKVKESMLVDIREKMLAGRAVVESVTRGKNVVAVYESMIAEDLRSDPEFHRLYQEKATREVIKSYEAASLANTFMDSFTKLPAKLTSMMARVLSAIARYVPVVGAVAAVGAEMAATYAEYGEGVSEKLKSHAGSLWSVRDLVNEKLVDTPTLSRMSLKQGSPLPMKQESPLPMKQEAGAPVEQKAEQRASVASEKSVSVTVSSSLSVAADQQRQPSQS